MNATTTQAAPWAAEHELEPVDLVPFLILLAVAAIGWCVVAWAMGRKPRRPPQGDKPCDPPLSS